jgi:hypothetical protein
MTPSGIWRFRGYAVKFKKGERLERGAEKMQGRGRSKPAPLKGSCEKT